MSETDTSKSIRLALESIGCVVRRVQCGTARSGRQRLAKAGTPDLWVARWHGVSGWLEVKRDPTEKPSPKQVAFHADMSRRGINCAVVCSVGAAIAEVQAWERRQQA